MIVDRRSEGILKPPVCGGCCLKHIWKRNIEINEVRGRRTGKCHFSKIVRRIRLEQLCQYIHTAREKGRCGHRAVICISRGFYAPLIYSEHQGSREIVRTGATYLDAQVVCCA